MSSRTLLLLALIASLLLVSSCGYVTDPDAEDEITSDVDDDDADDGSDDVVVDMSATLIEALAANDAPPEDPGEAWRDETLQEITCLGTTVVTESDSVTWDGDVLTISGAGCFSLSGTLDDARIVVDAADQDQVTLVLDGLTVASSVGSPLTMGGAALTLLYLEEGTVNTFTDADQYALAESVEDEPNAAVFCSDDLVVDGPGRLVIDASWNDGMTSKNGLLILDGDVDITATDDGIRGKDEIVVMGGTLVIDAGGDGLKSDEADDPLRGYVYVEGGSLTVDAGGDGLEGVSDVLIGGGALSITCAGGHDGWIADDSSARGLKAGTLVIVDVGDVVVDTPDDGVLCDGRIVVAGGLLTVSSGEDGIKADVEIEIDGGVIDVLDSVEGVESPSIAINGGEVHVVAADDCLNATQGSDVEGDDGSTLVLAGGWVHLDSNGGDPVDSNGTLTVSGGTVVVHGPTQGGTSVDVNGDFVVDGGLLVASTVYDRMTETPSDASSQRTILMTTSGTLSSGTLCRVEDSSGTNLMTFAPAHAWSCITFSSDDLIASETYRVYTGGSYDGTETDGLYSGGSYSGGTLATSFTSSATVQTVQF